MRDGKRSIMLSQKRGGSKMREGYSETFMCILATLHADQKLDTEVLVSHDSPRCHAKLAVFYKNEKDLTVHLTLISISYHRWLCESL
jgi:hypothetical protein